MSICAYSERPRHTIFALVGFYFVSYRWVYSVVVNDVLVKAATNNLLTRKEHFKLARRRRRAHVMEIIFQQQNFGTLRYHRLSRGGREQRRKIG